MDGVDAAPGFVRDLSPVSPNQMWAWSKIINAGWMPDRGIPTDFPYDASPNGY